MATPAKVADAPSLDAFSESLKQLQALHHHQVFALIREVAQLRGELGRSKGGAPSMSTDTSAEDPAPGWCVEELCPLKAHESVLVAPEAPEAPETLELLESERSRPLAPETPVALPEGRNEPPVADLPSKEKSEASQQKSESSERSARSPHAQPTTVHLSFREGVYDKSEQSEKSKSQVSYPSSGGKSVSHSVAQSITHAVSMKSNRRRERLFRQYDTFRAKNSPIGRSGFMSFWHRVVNTPAFDIFMGCVIALNAIAIGVESSLARSGDDTPFFLSILDYIFLIIYTAELSARFGAVGLPAIKKPWVQLDCFLVLCGMADIGTQLIGDDVTSHFTDTVDIVRTLRLVRLARMLRLMVQSNTLWMLVQGLLNSLGTLVWTCVILLILLFVFSVLGLELLTPDPSASEAYNEIAELNFGSLLRAMTTLLMGLSLDNFGEVYRPVILEKPFTALYFIPFFLIVPVALMNLVTALMVNFSMEQTSKDKAAEEQVLAEEKAEKVKILEQAFRELDTNRSGRIDMSEMLNAPAELQALIFDVADVKDGRQRELASIFTTLDFDKSGYLEISEFCEGLLKLNDPTALKTYATVRYCTNISRLLKDHGHGGSLNLGNALERVRGSFSMPR